MVGDKRGRDTNRCRAREKERLTEEQRKREGGKRSDRQMQKKREERDAGEGEPV